MSSLENRRFPLDGEYMNVEQLGAKLEECRRMKAVSLAADDIAVWEKLTRYYLELIREAERAKWPAPGLVDTYLS